ncbi:Protein NRT1/ PTR FAMILY 5.4 [Hibiscus syriacus]|uniref:Protein NRT1/ PTR FAMILY 5.4 n=1 Tax=Hibiscus syriacus TaxID=106335 RepID=A0A6A3B6P9_HIBSY|nr:protein NRT1/ PTR FAMILY 5.4-like [Hibiscus syriacus]KAE8711953.1 Protein NRT1/ PTR FAMILY 5.4 [Hibiscus syriacus]
MDSSVAPVTVDHDHKNPSNLSSQKHPSKGGWNAAVFVIFVEMAERFAFYGLAGNLISYLTNNLGEPVATAAKNVNTWVGVSAVFPLLGAFIADSYLGRFKTILASSLIYFLGMVLLSLSVSVIPMHCRKAVFFTALYLLAVGEGGHKPCVQTFAADQFDENNPQEKASKSSFFNWWYLGIVTGASVAIVVVIYLQDNVSWAAGFGVLAGSLAVALAVFLIGIKRYRKQRPTGSPFTTIAQVFVAAAKKWRVTETHGGRGICNEDDRKSGSDVDGQTRSHNLARTKQFRFLDKAMIIDNKDCMSRTKDPWRLCSLNQVEEVKLVLRLIPIWLACLMFSAVITQLHTFFTKQGATMLRSIGPNFQVPPAALQSLVGLTILIAVPVYDQVLVPIARKITGHPCGITMLQRIGTGLFISIMTMVVAGLVETARVNTASKNGLLDTPKAIVPMSIWWLIPQYVLTGIGDVFTVVGLQELFYDQMPEEMRSIGAAAYISVVGVGSFVNTAIISVVQAITSRHGDEWLGDNMNRANLNYFYWVLAGLSGANLCVYMWITKGFVYKKVENNDQAISDEGKELEMGGYLEAKV